MRKIINLAALIATVGIFCLILGCGSSQHTYTASSMTPTQLVAGAGDFTLTLTGSNFNNNSKVSFGSVVLSPTSVTSHSITVTVPAYATANAGVIDVKVMGDSISAPLQFTINNPVPSLVTLSQQTAMLNGASFPLDITGTNFVSTTTVSMGGQSLVPTAVSPTRLTVLVPTTLLTAANVIPLSVVNASPGGGSSNALNFTVLNPVPVLSSFSVPSVLVDSPDLALTINGSNFVAGATVTFGGTVLTPTALTATQLAVLVPRAAFTTGTVLAVTASNIAPGGGRSNALQFTVNNPVPVLSALSLTNTLVDSAEFTLNLTGTGFVPGATVMFGSTPLVPTAITSTQLSVLIPKESLTTSGVYSVTASNITPGGGISNALEFTVENPVPTLTALSLPSIGAGNPDFALTLTGTQFIASSKVNFGGTTLIPTAFTPTQLTVTVPAASVVGGGIFPVTVTNQGPGGGTTTAINFTVINPVPVLTALSQQNVVLGSPVFDLQITGTGFVPQSTVMFGTYALLPSAVTPTLLTVQITLDAMSKAGSLTITVVNPTPGGGTSNGLHFVVQNPVPAVTTLTPTSVTASEGDTVLTISGTSFVPGTTVTVGTTVLTPLSIQPQTLTVAVPAAELLTATSISLTVDNPTPGGGSSNTVTLVVHGKAAASWQTVVNNTMTMPNTTQNFNSYNQPSVNAHGTVVFKGQGQGKNGPTFGIYERNLFGGGMPGITTITDNSTAVPQPNNTTYNGQPATFIQFPSFPRIDIGSDTVAFRGQSQPVLTYTLPDGTETRAGSTGVFSNPTGPLETGLGLFGALPNYAYFEVPGAPPATRFDQFPGAPAVTGGNMVVFKGNYTDNNIGKTGVFFRDMVNGNGLSPVQLIANSNTIIPNQPSGGTVVFGSTAPPSAANGMAVFLGLDNEDAPTMGGLYAAPLTPNPSLQTLVAIGDQVPGQAAGATFTRISEGIGFDGRYVAFWGAWGNQTRTRLLLCPTDGNASIIAICNQMYPNGYQAKVPVNQGVFVYDLTTSTLTPITTNAVEFDDFVYWVFSGRPPNVGSSTSDEIPEPPRWRSSSFIALAGQAGNAFEVAFKASTGSVDGIYLAQGPTVLPIQTVLDTTMLGTTLDPQAPIGSLISTVGMERDSLRSNLLVVTSSMLDSLTTESGAGVYITRITPQ